MFCVIAPDGVYKYVNKTVEERFAFMGRSFVGLNILETILEEDRPIFKKAMELAIANPMVPKKVVVRKIVNPKTGVSLTSILELTANLSDQGEIIDFHAIGREHNVNDLQVELLQHISDSFFIINSKYEIEEYHYQSETNGVLEIEGVAGREFLQLIPAVIQKDVSKSIKSVLIGGDSESFSFERKFKNELKYFRAELSSISIQGIPHAFWIEKNISKEKRAEIELDESLSKMRVIWDSLPSLFHSINRNWEIEYANPAWETVWGLKKKDYLNKNFWELFPRVLGTKFESYYRTVMDTGQIAEPIEYYDVASDRWYVIEVYPSPNGIAVYSKDLTEKKQLELKDEEMELKLKKVWESVLDGYLLLNNDFGITYANPAWKAMFGAEGEFNNDKATSTLFSELKGHVFKDLLVNARDTGTVQRGLVYFEFRDLWVNAAIYPTDNGLAIYMQDVSSHEKMRTAMSDLSFMTSHELRHEYAKLHSVINLLSVSNADEKFLLKEAHKSLQQINSLISLMNDKLTFNRDNSTSRVDNEWMEFEEAILIDDDHVINFINARVIRLMFPGSRVKSFINAEKALSYLQEFDKQGNKLIFIDLNMPGFDGWDFLEAYRHLPIKSPVYILTSSINPKDLERSTQFDDVVKFLTKPLSSDLLESERIRPLESRES